MAHTPEEPLRVTTPADKLDLALLRKRDAGEFARMVHQHEGFVLGLCQTLGLSPADRDDAAAETFAIAYRGLEQFRGESELTTWLYRIAYRTALKVKRRYGSSAAELPEQADGKVSGPGAAAESRESQEMIWKAVAALEAEQAVVVEMYYRRGMSVEAIGAVMEKPAGTVKTLLHRARERLKFLLRRLDP